MDDLISTIKTKETRKRKARERKDDSVWFGLGMFGMIGWAVAIPTVLFMALGIWIDARWPGRISWTLTLLTVGLVVGCLTGWAWIKKESEGE